MTDRQTDRQTDRRTNEPEFLLKPHWGLKINDIKGQRTIRLSEIGGLSGIEDLKVYRRSGIDICCVPHQKRQFHVSHRITSPNKKSGKWHVLHQLGPISSITKNQRLSILEVGKITF